MSTMYEFMQAREKSIHAMGSRDPEAVAAYYKHRHQDTIHSKAMSQQRADPSDPFVFDRVMAHFDVGLPELSDYEVTFRMETEVVGISRETGEALERTYEVPLSRKVLCG